ncbi:TKL protein kinase [Phytophthora palmivora]|uniref:TKL protein kinase n=1 Tax=Phytophthora palmivora TaxID=4796 RepID=A0A2P4XZL3_9STRA|nr:TKL protein kinase [Phytophthora palmivora]
MSAVVNILINGETKDATRSTTIDRAPHPPRINRWRRNNRLPKMDRTPDRLGDYLVALRNAFVATNSSCSRGLNLSGELKAYENETRVLLKLASTGRVVNILQRFGGVVESYMKVMKIEMTEEVRQWRDQLDIERQERVQLFREILNDELRFIEAMGDETQQLELLTLLQHDLTRYEKLLTPEELDIVSDVYDRVVNYSEIVLVGGPPSWFLSPNDLLCEQGGICYLDSVRVSKCETGEVLRSFGGNPQSWEDQEEACLCQATVWADLNHPHLAKLLGACHIGKRPFVVHEPAEPLVSNRANAQSWEPLLGWALGLQYLHERELGYKNFDDSRLMARHHVTASGVLSGLGLVPVKRKVSVPLQRGVSNMINLIDLAVSLPQNDDEDNLHDWHAPTWSVLSDIFAFGMAIYNTRQWVSMYSDEKVAVLPHECFVSVVDPLYKMLTRRDFGKKLLSSSVIANFCSSRAAAQNFIIFHHEIDRLLALAELRDSLAVSTHVTLTDIREDSTDSIDTAPDPENIHDWQVKWNKMRREQLRAFQACLNNTEGLRQQLSNPQDRIEAQMLLQFELHKRRSSYPDSVLEAIAEALNVLEGLGDGTDGVPSWFIPPYEIVLGKCFAQGVFGDVYYGKWFDTEVVVKILKPQTRAASSGKASPPTSSSEASEEDAMELFRREADHWFMLNHQNVVHLYGACHVGTPFFVCEPAKSTSLNAHIKSLACAKPGYNYEENGGDPSDIMRCLFLASIGLKYLHERGIVHCDLKGNNFMVGIDGKTIKLGGLGMSALKRSGKSRHRAHANVGAVPWKAPEYLKGDDATVMSDIYGFGMCILELLSGSIPWSRVPEAAVKFHVTKRKALPPRPKKLNDFQWSLIRHMCCYEPSERISLDAVVDLLHTFRFG